ncbi:MAG: alpha/beta fold hydrolase [Actinomycetota bacterium]
MRTAAAGPCKNHPRRDGVTTCVVCDSPICAECLVQTPVGMKCRECTGTGRAATASSRGARRRDAPARRPRWTAIVAVAGLAVVVVASIVLTRDRGSTPASVSGGGDQLDRAVQFRGGGDLRISATLSLPAAARKARVPAVLIVPGAGPTDRNGVNVSGGIPDNLYEDIAQRLVEQGVATLRYDKRGSGLSPIPQDQVLTFDDLVADARAGIGFLRDRREVDAARLAVVGHDIGGLVAMRAAGADRSIRGLVLISTPGRPLVDVLADDLRNTTSDPAHAATLITELRSLAGTLVAGGEVPDVNALDPVLRSAFQPGAAPYTRALFAISPPDEARQVGAPVLIVRGGRSTGISAEDAVRLAAAFGSRAEVLVSDRGGQTLRVPVEAPQATPSLSAADEHELTEHQGAVAGERRDLDTLQQIVRWITARVSGRV